MRIPRPTPALATILLLVVVSLSPAFGLPLPGQDDAGSGGDAPGTFADAFPIAPGTHEGAVGSPGDVDYYKLAIPAGTRIDLRLEATPEGAEAFDAVRAHLVRPDGENTVSTWAQGAAAHETMTVTETGGDWRIRVTSDGVPETYTFHVATRPAFPTEGAAQTGGYVSLTTSFEPAACGRVRLGLDYALPADDRGEVRIEVPMRTGDGAWKWGFVHGSGTITSVHAQAHGHRVFTNGLDAGDVRLPAERHFISPTVCGADLTLVPILVAPHGRVTWSVEGDVDGATVLPPVLRGRDHVLHATPWDADGTTVRASGATATLGGDQAFMVDGTFLARSTCEDTCRLVAPDGLPVAPGIVVGGAGTWHVEYDAHAGNDYWYDVLGVDLVLPAP